MGLSSLSLTRQTMNPKAQLWRVPSREKSHQTRLTRCQQNASLSCLRFKSNVEQENWKILPTTMKKRAREILGPSLAFSYNSHSLGSTLREIVNPRTSSFILHQKRNVAKERSLHSLKCSCRPREKVKWSYLNTCLVTNEREVLFIYMELPSLFNFRAYLTSYYKIK